MASLYEKIFRPIFFRLDPENVHELGITALRVGLGTKPARGAALRRWSTDDAAAVERFGLSFANPLGVAAGFDKNARVVDQLAALGFGFVETGTVTLRQQPGNDKPRMFRLPADKALINRLGFNNEGAEAIVKRLSVSDRRCVIGVNIGKNKDVPNEEAAENYLACFDIVRDAADYIAINISSPNTPGLRELQKSEQIAELLSALQARNNESANPKPLLVKIAPDLSDAEIETITGVSMDTGISGIIATNTTVSRKGLRTPKSAVDAIGAGGLSGKPVAAASNYVISRIFDLSGGNLPVVGVGGIFTPEDAFAKIAAGASLLQAYTGFVYHGPSFARFINAGIAGIVAEKGFSSLNEAIGTDLVRTRPNGTVKLTDTVQKL